MTRDDRHALALIPACAALLHPRTRGVGAVAVTVLLSRLHGARAAATDATIARLFGERASAHRRLDVHSSRIAEAIGRAADAQARVADLEDAVVPQSWGAPAGRRILDRRVDRGTMTRADADSILTRYPPADPPGVRDSA